MPCITAAKNPAAVVMVNQKIESRPEEVVEKAVAAEIAQPFQPVHSRAR
jgi:hypothetical protein